MKIKSERGASAFSPTLHMPSSRPFFPTTLSLPSTHHFSDLLCATIAGARIGRYIVASTTAKYNEPENVFSVPCDLVFPCAQHNVIDATAATMLADMGCQGRCTREALLLLSIIQYLT